MGSKARQDGTRVLGSDKKSFAEDLASAGFSGSLIYIVLRVCWVHRAECQRGNAAGLDGSWVETEPCSQEEVLFEQTVCGVARLA